MVEVTRSNFNEIFPTIERSIRNSSFIAFDSEFTGISLGPSNENNLFDKLRVRYEKLKCRANSFIPCQIGLSMFTKCLHENSYSVDTYVFYIRPCMIGSIDKVFTCQASALDFLCGYNFDFNKFIREGIPYVNENEESIARQQLEDGSICLPHDKMQDSREQLKINNTINHELMRHRKSSEKPKEKITFPIDGKSHVYFQLRKIRRTFPTLWAFAENDKIVVEMVSPEVRKTLEEYEALEHKSVVDDFVGFTKVFRLLKECQKPIVGHNLLMDLMLFYQNFHQNLPDSYKKYKKELHRIFPVIYDTKHMWLEMKEIKKFSRFGSCSSLPVLYQLLKNPPDHLATLYSPLIVPSNCMHYFDAESDHDSGYDAFITGFAFIKLCHMLASHKSPTGIVIKPLTFNQHLDAVAPFVNKVNFPYFTFKYINFGGTDPLPEGPGCIYIAAKNKNETLSVEMLNTYFISYHGLHFKLMKGQRAAILLAQAFVLERILREYKDNPDLIVEKYRSWKHSPYVTPTLWLMAATCGVCLGAWIWNSS